MTNNSSPHNDNDRNAVVAGEDKADDQSDFATADVYSITREFKASSDEAAKVAQNPEINSEHVVFIRNGRGRRGSSIL